MPSTLRPVLIDDLSTGNASPSEEIFNFWTQKPLINHKARASATVHDVPLKSLSSEQSEPTVKFLLLRADLYFLGFSALLVQLLKNMVSRLSKSVLSLERFAAQKQKELPNRKIRLEASPEEIKQSPFSPRLLQSLRKSLGITQKELAILAGVTVGAAHLWEKGKVRPKDTKKSVFVALRKLNRREVRGILNQKIAGKTGR